MKKTLLASAAAIITTLAACNHFETSGNGSLDGFWQLTHMDTLDTGRSGDVRNHMIFWSVQANLIELTDRHEDENLGPQAPSVFYHFERSGDTLRLLSDPKPIINNRRISDRTANRVDVRTYGLSNLSEDLRILQLTGNHMTLETEYLRMYFHKY